MRIGVVNDVPLAVEALRRVVTSVPGYEVAWIARDGEEAVKACAGDVPDIVLMDLIMPRMDGVEATRRIMQESPCAILIVTATVEGNTPKVFEAMGWGALDAVDTPILKMSGDPSGGQALLSKIAVLSRLAGAMRARPEVPTRASLPETRDHGVPLVAIGASTGGPIAVASILEQIPRTISASVAIVQHVDQRFAPGLAEWLASKTGHRVVTIQPQDKPARGQVMLASSNDHLVMAGDGTYHYTVKPAEFLYRPSIDVFFDSLVHCHRGPVVGVLLTGMGMDGAQGLLRLRQAGCHTIAQDEATSVVYGMPKAAARLHAAVEILPLNEIAPGILRALHIVGIQGQRT